MMKRGVPEQPRIAEPIGYTYSWTTTATTTAYNMSTYNLTASSSTWSGYP